MCSFILPCRRLVLLLSPCSHSSEAHSARSRKDLPYKSLALFNRTLFGSGKGVCVCPNTACKRLRTARQVSVKRFAYHYLCSLVCVCFTRFLMLLMRQISFLFCFFFFNDSLTFQTLLTILLNVLHVNHTQHSVLPIQYTQNVRPRVFRQLINLRPSIEPFTQP